MSPARAGVDESRRSQETVFNTGDPKQIDVFMGDQNEVMLKMPNDVGRFHRRWYPEGIAELIANLETITVPGGPQTYLESRDNKDRYTVLWLDASGAVKMTDSLSKATSGDQEVDLPWAELKKAWRKAVRKPPTRRAKSGGEDPGASTT